MTWHVIRLAPGALKAHELFTGQKVVERSLREAGVSFYLPFEHKTVTNPKTKKKIVRDFPLMPGYGFVEGVANFEALRQCDGVMDVIKSAGRPVPIPTHELAQIVADERAINAEHDRKRSLAAAREKLGTRALLSQAFAANTMHTISPAHKLLSGETATVEGVGARGRIKVFIARLNGMSVEIDAAYLEAAE